MEVYWKRREEGRERILGRVTEERQGGGRKKREGETHLLKWNAVNVHRRGS